MRTNSFRYCLSVVFIRLLPHLVTIDLCYLHQYIPPQGQVKWTSKEGRRRLDGLLITARPPYRLDLSAFGDKSLSKCSCQNCSCSPWLRKRQTQQVLLMCLARCCQWYSPMSSQFIPLSLQRLPQPQHRTQHRVRPQQAGAPVRGLHLQQPLQLLLPPPLHHLILHRQRVLVLR